MASNDEEVVPHLKLDQISGFFIIAIVGISLRLIDISQPFVDAWSWRQSDVGMIARNFYLNGYQILYPQIDWAGYADGYVGTEFPLVPFTAALAYGVFGEHEWVGRSISLIFFSISIPFFYLLVKELFGNRAALFSLCFYTLNPLSIYTSRFFSSDMASLSLMIIGIYFFHYLGE